MTGFEGRNANQTGTRRENWSNFDKLPNSLNYPFIMGLWYILPTAKSNGKVDMTDSVENLILEHLRAIRSTLDDHGDRLNRIELRLSAIEQTLGSLYALSGSDRATI